MEGIAPAQLLRARPRPESVRCPLMMRRRRSHWGHSAESDSSLVATVNQLIQPPLVRRPLAEWQAAISSALGRLSLVRPGC